MISDWEFRRRITNVEKVIAISSSRNRDLSTEFIGLLLDHGMHWMNKREVKFIKELE